MSTPLTEDVAESIRIPRSVEQVAIRFKELTDRVLVEGVKPFANAFDKLLKATDRRGQASDHDPVSIA